MSNDTIWVCKIGNLGNIKLPSGADFPMRQAVREAFYKLTGKWPDFTFSGWGGELTTSERIVATMNKEVGYPAPALPEPEGFPEFVERMADD